MQSIAEIKALFQVDDELEIKRLLEEYSEDTRAGVQKIILAAQKRLDKLDQERARMEVMKSFEREYGEYQYIAGVDEVGRGPLAGPVVTCAVILPKDCDLLYINDSKKVPEKLRETLAEQIKECAVAYNLGIREHTVIDEVNILQATLQAMQDAVNGLDPQPDLLLNDAVTIPNLTMKQVPIVKGDAKSISIAAASIVAKTTRDELMVQYDALYPEYDFANNKGYGSPKHIAALKKYGPCPIHRQSFIKNFV